MISPSAASSKPEPVNDVRVVNGEFALDADGRDWLRLHDIRDLYGDGYYVHTFQRLIPWQTWFAAHPEYFALMNGKRVIDQPCLARPEVFDIAVADSARKWPPSRRRRSGRSARTTTSPTASAPNA